MRRGAFAVLFALAAAGCAESPSLQDAGDDSLAVREGPLPVTRLAPDYRPLADWSGLMDSARLVVRDAQTLRQVWGEIWRYQSYRPPLPVVDFAREMVVVAAMGARPSTGYQIYVEGAYQWADHVEVAVRKVSPSGRCVAGTILTASVDVARIPASPQPVRFRESDLVREC